MQPSVLVEIIQPMSMKARLDGGRCGNNDVVNMRTMWSVKAG